MDDVHRRRLLSPEDGTSADVDATAAVTSAALADQELHLSLTDSKTWSFVRRRIWDRFYLDIVESIDCGPFDGGCVVVAQALQKVMGGEVCVLTRANGRADHAAILIDGNLWDWDGPASPDAFIRRFNDLERANATGWRTYEEGDLPDAPRNEDLTRRLADLIASAIEAYHCEINPINHRHQQGK